MARPADDEVPWSGLWHHTRPPGAWPRELAVHALTYLVMPLLIALFGIRGDDDFLAEVWIGYQRAFVVMLCVAGLFELQYRLVWPFILPRKPGWGVRIAAHVVAVALAVVAGTFLAAVALEALWGYPAARVRARLWGSVTVVSVIVIAVQATVDEMRARALRSDRRATRARVAALRAELAALQARTDPHFLFNSLNTVASLIPDDPALAERTLERLSDVFRYALDAGRRATVTLADELRAVEAYLDVEATRLGDRLRWRIDADPDVGTFDLPPLALQPLAENAVLHGAQRRRGATMITVTARRTGDSVELAVEDRPIDAPAPATTDATARRPGAGTALADLQARLALAYGDGARLDAAPLAPAGWRTTITLPLSARP